METSAPQQVDVTPQSPEEGEAQLATQEASGMPEAASDIYTTSTLLPLVFVRGDAGAAVNESGTQLDHKTLLRMHWSRFCWMCVFAVCYYISIVSTMKQRRLLAADVSQFMEEFFPESDKTGERIVEGEMTSGFGELQAGDGLGKTLTWIQQFCMIKVGADDHVPWAWGCSLGSIEIGKKHPVNWDIVANSMPPNGKTRGLQKNLCSNEFIARHVLLGDDPRQVPWGDVDAFMERVKWELQQPQSPLSTVTKEEVADALEEIEAGGLDGGFDEFHVFDGMPLNAAINEGFDEKLPAALEKLGRPTKKGPVLQQLVMEPDLSGATGMIELKKSTGGCVRALRTAANSTRSAMQSFKRKFRSEGFRQKFDIALNPSSHLQPRQSMNKTMQDQKSLRTTSLGDSLSEMETFVNSLRRLHRESSGCDRDGVPAEVEGEDPAGPKEKLQNRSDGNQISAEDDPARPGNSDGQTNEEDQKSAEVAVGDEEDDSLDEEPEVDLPPWCFIPPRGNELKLVLRTLQTFGIDMREPIPKDRFIHVCKKLKLPDCEGETWKLFDTDKDGKTEFKEIVAVTTDKPHLFSDTPPFLLRVCRNHHWFMLPMCGPDTVEVVLHVENTNVDPSATTANAPKHREAFFDVTLKFEQIGYDHDNPRDTPSGWYEAGIQVDVSQFWGALSWWHASFQLLTLILFFFLFVVDGLATIINFPYFVARMTVPTLRLAVEDFSEVQSILSSCIDGRQVRRRFMSFMLLLNENLIAICFCLAIVDSVTSANQPKVPLLGNAPNPECDALYQAQEKKFFESGDFRTGGFDYSNVISPLDYIKTCLVDATHPTALSRFPEMLRELVFESPRFHGLAFGLVAVRLLDIFNGFKGTEWVPRTIELSVNQLFFFLLFYMFTIGAFACLLQISFGSQYKQFSTFNRCSFVLILFSFGFTDQALDGIQAFERTSGFWVTAYLLAFTVIVISVSMNFFTTIIMDSYAQVTDDEQYIENKVKESSAFAYSVASVLFPNAIEEEDMELYQKQIRIRVQNGLHISALFQTNRVDRDDNDGCE